VPKPWLTASRAISAKTDAQHASEHPNPAAVQGGQKRRERIAGVQLLSPERQGDEADGVPSACDQRAPRGVGKIVPQRALRDERRAQCDAARERRPEQCRRGALELFLALEPKRCMNLPGGEFFPVQGRAMLVGGVVHRRGGSKSGSAVRKSGRSARHNSGRAAGDDSCGATHPATTAGKAAGVCGAISQRY
jgi:hypothetical protein